MCTYASKRTSRQVRTRPSSAPRKNRKYGKNIRRAVIAGSRFKWGCGGRGKCWKLPRCISLPIISCESAAGLSGFLQARRTCARARARTRHRFREFRPRRPFLAATIRRRQNRRPIPRGGKKRGRYRGEESRLRRNDRSPRHESERARGFAATSGRGRTKLALWMSVRSLAQPATAGNRGCARGGGICFAPVR